MGRLFSSSQIECGEFVIVRSRVKVEAGADREV
jgi:hypothetical protein